MTTVQYSGIVPESLCLRLGTATHSTHMLSKSAAKQAPSLQEPSLSLHDSSLYRVVLHTLYCTAFHSTTLRYTALCCACTLCYTILCCVIVHGPALHHPAPHYTLLPTSSVVTTMIVFKNHQGKKSFFNLFKNFHKQNLGKKPHRSHHVILYC